MFMDCHMMTTKLIFLAELAAFCGGSQEPTLLGGDFYLIRFSSEKNRLTPLSKHSQTFNSLIACYDLLDLKMIGGKYTWSNNQNPPTLERPDRILVSKNWEDLFPMATV